MGNKSPLLNVIFQSLNKITRNLVRDFGEIENLQISPNSIVQFVTKTESHIKASIIEDLSKARPDWEFKSNSNNKTVKNQYYWILDTLNGKINFSHAFPYFAISIAVECNDEIISTVIMDPLRDEVYFAEKGKGAFQNDRRIRVSKRTSINSCIFSIYDNSIENKDIGNNNYYQNIKNLASQHSSVTREFGSSALSFAWLASGKIDCLFTHNLNKNQIACGELLIKEAGGYITNLKYINAYKAPRDEIIAANPVIHKEVLKKFRTIDKK